MIFSESIVSNSMEFLRVCAIKPELYKKNQEYFRESNRKSNWPRDTINLLLNYRDTEYNKQSDEKEKDSSQNMKEQFSVL